MGSINRGLVAAAALLVAGTATSQGQARGTSTPEQRYQDWAAPPFAAVEYASRRAALVERLRASGDLFLVPSAHGRSHGETFRQLDDFFSGVSARDEALDLRSIGHGNRMRQSA